MQRHFTWKLINCVCQIHSNCFPIRKCPLVHIVYFLLFAVSLKTSYRWYHTFFFLDWKKMHICGESLQLSFWKMEKDFFVTCHGLSFSRGLLSKGFQAVQEKECIIYDIFVAGSGFFWARKYTLFMRSGWRLPTPMDELCFLERRKKKFSIRELPDCFMNTCCQRK